MKGKWSKISLIITGIQMALSFLAIVKKYRQDKNTHP